VSSQATTPSFLNLDGPQGCRTLASAEALASGLPDAKAIAVDVTSPEALDAQVAAHDVIISLVPYIYHPQVIKSAIKNKKHAVTTSYVSPEIRALEPEVKKAGIVVLNEIGLDPGIDHLYAVKTIDEVHEKGGKVGQNSFVCSFAITEVVGESLDQRVLLVLRLVAGARMLEQPAWV
jgi:hypothetical protein